MNTENRIKEIENLLNGCITNEISTHENRMGFIVHDYRLLGYNNTKDITISVRLRSNGYEPVKTHSSYCFDMFNENTLTNVSYCEGDVGILVFDNLEEFNKHKQSAIEFYKEN